MKSNSKKTPAILVILALILIAVFAFTRNGQEGGSQEQEKIAQPEGETVMSDDGSASLFIPDGALPEGVSLSDISISPLEEEDDWRGYKLEPDGTTFLKPVKIAMAMDSPENTDMYPLPQIYHVTDEAIESPEMVDFTLDPESGKLTIEAEISHFSDVVFSERQYIVYARIDPENDSTFYLDQPFAWEFEVGMTGQEIQARDLRSRPYTEKYAEGEKYMIAPDNISDNIPIREINGNVEPALFRMPKRELEEDEIYEFTQPLVCKSAGRAYLRSSMHGFMIYYKTLLQTRGRPDSIENKRIRFRVVRNYNCEAIPEGMEMAPVPGFEVTESGEITRFLDE